MCEKLVESHSDGMTLYFVVHIFCTLNIISCDDRNISIVVQAIHLFRALFAQNIVVKFM